MSHSNSQSLDEFLTEAAELLRSFESYWTASHAHAPGIFPMRMSIGNEGLWSEQLWEHDVHRTMPMTLEEARAIGPDALVANETTSGQSLAEFVAEEKERQASFATQWRAAHRQNPSAFPMSMPEENLGLWYEALREFDEKQGFVIPKEAKEATPTSRSKSKSLRAGC